MGKSQRTGPLVAIRPVFRRRYSERPNGGKRMPYMDVGLRLPEKEEEEPIELTCPCTFVCIGSI